MRKFIYLSILAFCGACSYHFDIEEMGENPKLVIYSFPGNQDTTFIQVSKSISVSSKQDQQTALADAKITFCVNGKEKEVRYAEKGSTSISQACYYALGKFYPGDRIEIKAEAENLPAVSSRTEIPAFFPLKQFNLVKKLDTYGKKIIQFQISLQDDPSETNYYGVVIEKISSYDDGYYIDSPLLDTEEEPLLHQTGALDDLLLGDSYNNNYGGMYIFSDNKINGKEYTLRLNDRNSYQPNSDYPDGTWSRFYYRVTVFGLSADYYLYAKNILDLRNNELGRYGLSPIRPAYTNIQNGLGLLGGYSMGQSEWVENI